MAPPSKTLMEALIDKFDVVDSGCWEWTAAKVRGYGYVKSQGRSHRAHRAMYREVVGPIPDGFHLHHVCENPGCVNPDHLEPITPGDHSRETASKVTHCPAGHEYTEENTYVWHGMRDCRQCTRDRMRRKGQTGA